MQPLRVALSAAVTFAIVITVGFGYALHRIGVPGTETALLCMAVLAVIVVPWYAVVTWSRRVVLDLDQTSRTLDEQRTTMQQQRASYEQQGTALQKIVGAIGEGLMALNREGRVVFTNTRVGEMFGFDDAMAGRPYLEIVRKQPLVEAFQRALRGEESTARVSVSSETGERRIEIRVVPVPSSDIAVVALFIDVTEIERLQLMRKDFLDDFSHEVRTPLAGLQSAAESFDGHLTVDQEKQLRAIMLRQLDRIRRLVSDLWELNQIESGGLVLERHHVDLFSLASDVCEEFRRRVTQPMTFSALGNPTLVFADSARLQQILTNLLDNATKHGGAKGEVLIEVSSEHGEAVLRVSDQGEGIPPEDMERIFNRFYRVDRSRSVPGAGLGLAIAKHLVALHSGTIKAFNRPGGGATFEVRLPLAVGESSAARAS